MATADATSLLSKVVLIQCQKDAEFRLPGEPLTPSLKLNGRAELPVE